MNKNRNVPITQTCLFLVMPYTDRIVILVDADCFYCQVEEKLDPSLTGKPIAVVQFNAWRDGGIIAVNYAARAKGCTKGMWMNEAKQKCPEIKFARVTNVRGRADLTKYREASKQVADVLLTFTQNIERASIDESYIDVTDLVNKKLQNGFQQLTVGNLPDSHIVGSEITHFLNNLEEYNEFTEANCRLAIGGLIAQEMRAAILQKTGYKCSAGIAHNKILAKLACGFHKPNQQTILPSDAVSELFSRLPLNKIKRLGGKFGESVSQALQVTNVGDLLQFSEKELTKKFDEKTGKWLYNIARGIDLEPVMTRIISKSISCCKRFPFKHVLTALGSVEHWLNELAIEVTDRLDQELAENNRRAKQITISFAQEIEKKTISGSKTFPIASYKQEKIFHDAFEIVRKNLVIKADGSVIVNFLGLTAGNFQENTKNSIVDLFKNVKTSRMVKDEDKMSERHDNIIENGKADAETDTSTVKFELEMASTSNCAIKESECKNNKLYTPNKSEVSSIEDDQTLFMPEQNHSFTNLDIKFSYDDCSYSSDEFNTSIDEDEAKDIEDECPEFLVPMQNRSETYKGDIKDANTQNSDEYRSRVGHDNVGVDQPEEPNTSSTSLKDQYAKSFFLNYFANLEKVNQENRIREKEFQELTENIFKKTPLKTASSALQSPEPQQEPEEGEVCSECHKNILGTEMVSHMDYHFAMRLVNGDEQAVMNKDKPVVNDKKQNVSPSSSNSKKSSTKSSSSNTKSKNGSKVKKRSSLETKPITSFLEKIDDLNDSNSDVCGECRKRVRFEDLDGHSDYHAAKRLHTELNSNVKSTNSVVDNSVVKKNVRSSRDISSFFKKA